MPQNRHKTGFGGPSPEVGTATQFKPGNRANPGGRPSRKPLTDELARILQDPKEANRIARAHVREAANGRCRKFKEIADRIEGKVANCVEVSAAEGEAIHAKVDAKLSNRDLVEALRTVYGINSDPTKAAEPQHV